MKKRNIFGSLLLTSMTLISCTFGMKEVDYWDAKQSFTSSKESPYKSVSITGSYVAKAKDVDQTIKINSKFTIKGDTVVSGYNSFSNSEVIAYTIFSMNITKLNSTYERQKITPKYYLGSGDVQVIAKVNLRQLLSSSELHARNDLDGTYQYNTYGLIVNLDETQKITENGSTATMTTKIELKYSEK